MYWGLVALNTFVPFYLVQGRGLSALEVGAIVAIFPFTALVVAQGSGWVGRQVGTTRLMVGGILTAATGLFLFSTLTGGSAVTLLIPWLLVSGVGLGLFDAPNMASLMGTVDPTRLGTASASVNTSRGVGQSIGLAVSGALFTAQAGSYAAARSPAGLEDALVRPAVLLPALPPAVPPAVLLSGLELAFAVAGVVAVVGAGRGDRGRAVGRVLGGWARRAGRGAWGRLAERGLRRCALGRRALGCAGVCGAKCGRGVPGPAFTGVLQGAGLLVAEQEGDLFDGEVAQAQAPAGQGLPKLVQEVTVGGEPQRDRPQAGVAVLHGGDERATRLGDDAVRLGQALEEFRWIGVMGGRAIMSGEHVFESQPAGDGTRFLHWERFCGLLIHPIMRIVGGKTRAGFESMNEALTRRVETGAGFETPAPVRAPVPRAC